MLVDIDKIKVGDRIRKDFGDIGELAADIEANGLINPPTINKEYVLLAGERRLRACKSLGWKQITVHMLDTKDEAHDLAVEMSENNLRRNFTGSELAEGIRRQMAIEVAKAKERSGARTDLRQTFATGEGGRSRDKAAEQFGISGEQARKTLFVADNRDLLDPADFADWDEGRLSTNKAYQRIKAAQAEAIRERDQARRELQDAYRAGEAMEAEAASLRRQLAERPEVEVVPEDYAKLRKRVRELEHDNKVYLETDERLRRRLKERTDELDKAKDLLGMDKAMKDVRLDAQYLIASTNSYVRRYGGLTWTVESLADLDEATIGDFRKAAKNLATFANALMTSLEEIGHGDN